MDLDERRFQIGLLGATAIVGGLGIAASGAVGLGLAVAAAGLVAAGWGLAPFVVSRRRSEPKVPPPRPGLSSFEFPKPDNWKSFETYCLKVFRRYLGAPDLQKYAREGQPQDGVDLFGTTRDHTRCGIQCKRKGGLSRAEILAEVEKAKGFEPPLDRYIIATTAKREPAFQRLAAEVTDANAKEDRFSVAVYAWEDIEEILKAEPGLYQEIYAAPLPRGRAPSPLAQESPEPPSPPAPSGVHLEIDQAFEFVKKDRPEVTIELLQQIRRSRWDGLTPRERYRVVANIGNARLALQDREGAARDYLQAVDLLPTDEDARALEALAHHLAQDRDKAYELAVVLCQDHPSLGRAHMLRIRTAPDDSSLDELLESVPTPLRSHPEVALALHDRAVAESRLEDAEDIVREYTREGHGWPALTLALATTILQREVAAHRVTADGPVGGSPRRLEEARDLFGKVLEQVSEGDPDKLAFSAYLNRGLCQQLLALKEPAYDDFLSARAISPTDERVAIALARSAHPDRQDQNEAIRVLDRFLQQQESPMVSLLLAEYLSQRGDSGDLKRATALLEALLLNLGQLESIHREDLVSLLATLYARTGEPGQAVEFVEGLESLGLRPVVRHAIVGEVHRRCGNAERALAEAEAASDALGESTDWNDARRVALLLQRIERYSEAFKLWSRIVPPEFVTRETLDLLRCAGESGEEGFIRDFCRRLRERGIYDRRTLLLEVRVLTQYNQNKEARAVFEEYLDVRPGDKIARLHKTALGLRQGWEDLVERDLGALPSVDEVDDPQMGRLVADILRSGPEPTQAVDYAYDLYRRFPEDSEAHSALIVALHAPGPAGVNIEKPAKVAPGTAVCYEEVGGEEKRWLVVEDRERPSLTRSEYASTEGLAPAMLGKSIGDEFPLAGGSVRPRTARIVEIQDKRVYRANDLMISWPQHFPDKPYFVPVPVAQNESPGPEDFAELVEVMERLNEPRDRAKSVYSAGKIPITTFADVMGLSVFETVLALAGDGDLQIRASRGTNEDTDAAVQLLDAVEYAVLDPTAVTMLALLEEEEVVARLPFRCLITEGTLQEIRDLARDDLPTSRAHGYGGAKDGRLWFHENDPKQQAEQRERLTEVADRLEEHCEVIGGGDLAAVEFSVRQKLLQCVVQTSAEAAAAATERGAVLWSDDHLFWEMVKGDLPGQRVWTQAVFIWANLRGLLARQVRSRITARLLAFGYFFTSSNPMAVIDTCEAANWDTDDVNLRAVLADFGSRAWDYETALGITAQAVARIWRDAPSPEHARAVTAHLLSHLAAREDHLRIVQFLAGNVEALLVAGPIVIPREDQLREVLRTYLGRGGLSL